ncbi:protein arginine n-methyltransferase, partial [Nannochloropsis gaditana CCMP526]|uniref:protein arginine n-methyltransferase n=1 Tax=Nannochloropsis gaditana (strain CCMP526) TaxID=1093141 RepID=UPI00029F5303
RDQSNKTARWDCGLASLQDSLVPTRTKHAARSRSAINELPQWRPQERRPV